MSENDSDFVKGLLVGGIAGALIGILFAPKSGEETREELGRKTEELVAKARNECDRALEKSRSTYEAAITRLRELEATAHEKVDYVEEEVSGLAEKGKEVLEDGKSRLKKAIDAGIGAFKEEKSS